jgi:hypothetical protein
MTIRKFADLTQFADRKFPDGYPVEETVTLCTPHDKLAPAVAWFIDQAEHSLALTIGPPADPALKAALLRVLQDGKKRVLLHLTSLDADSSVFQAYGGRLGNFVVSVTDTTRVVAGSADGLDSFTGGPHCVTFARHPLIAFRVRDQIERLILG